jgi:hypothetical protein
MELEIPVYEVRVFLASKIDYKNDKIVKFPDWESAYEFIKSNNENDSEFWASAEAE